MLDQQSRHDQVAIDVLLRLDASLDQILAAGGPLHITVSQSVEQRLTDLVRLLGIPGRVALKIEALHDSDRRDAPWMTLRVNGSLCRYPDDVLLFAWSYVKGRLPDGKPADVRSWLLHVAHAQAGDESPVAEFLGLACAEIVSRQPEVLLGPAQAAAYRVQMQDQADAHLPQPLPQNPTWLLSILKHALALRLSIADVKRVAKVVVAGGEAPWEQVAEQLVEALATDVVELHVPDAYIQPLTRPQKDWSDLLTFAREGMFTELGVLFPPCRLEPTSELKPNSFNFVINHLPTLPLVGLEAGDILVNDTPERLRLMGIEGRGAVNVATAQPAAIVDGTKKAVLDATGLSTWDQAGYFILCLAEALRRNCACFVHPRATRIQLEQLTWRFPALVEVAHRRVSVEQLTRVLRSLADEQVAISNLRLILERLLDFPYRTSDLGRVLILDDRLSISGFLDNRLRDDENGDLVPFIRSGLKRQISYKSTRSTATLVVYLIDPELERLFDGPDIAVATGPEDEDKQEKLIAAIARELGFLPPTAQTPSLLTATNVRGRLRAAIKLTFPRLVVLAYQDLPADLNIQPIARISLP